MDKLLIVDGSNLLFQMFYGMPTRIVNEKGKAIQGTLGFVGALLKIINMINPSHIIVVFDGEHENERCELEPKYKANRIDFSDVCEEENPYSQLHDVYKALQFMEIKYFETTQCEADDLIASYVLAYTDMEIVISSFDSDFFQLLSDKVSILRYQGKRTIIYTPDYFREKFDIIPSQYADYKSLVGDAADNIKGADKIGKKTAACLLNAFGTLDGIILNANQISKPSIRGSIINNTDRIRINYQLIKLKNIVELPFDKCLLEYHYSGITTMGVLKGIRLK